MHEDARRVARHTLASYAQFAVTFGVQVVLVPLVIGTLGEQEYGLWALAFSVLGFFTLLDFGLGPGVVKFVASSRGSGAIEYRNRMVSTILGIYLGLALVAVLLTGGLSLFYGPLLDIPEDARGRAVAVLLILSARTWAVSLPFGIFRGVLFGNQHIALLALIQIGSSLLLGAGTWAVLSLGHGLVAVALVNLGAFALEHAAYVLATLRLVPDLRLSLRLFDRALLREATSFGVFQFLVSVASLVLLRTDVLLVQWFLGLSMVALYAVPLKIAEYAVLLLKPFVNNLTPLAARMGGAGDAQGLRRLTLLGSRLAVAPAGLLCASSAVFGEDALRHWVGDSFVAGAPVMTLLLLALTLSLPQWVISAVFTMTGRHRFTALAAAAGMIVNLVASILLVHPLGLVGIALGTVCAALLVDALFVADAGARSIGMSWGRFAWRTWGGCLLPAALLVAAGMGLRSLWEPGTLAEVVLLALPGGLLYLASFLMLSLGPEERALLRRRSAPESDATG
ncbi:MAG TPA: oligosaccharide flippase family protein [Myxococcota bacterium]|nr:oligosaccharide flippase family protein [Myxococcota bacterium]HQK50212.1 oligosaccharide flippase family protein [Myxococcota bacterium]